MKNLILINRTHVATKGEEFPFPMTTPWREKHKATITYEYAGNLCESIKSREELYKFLRDCCLIEKFTEILEMPENLEALDLEDFAYYYNQRIELERCVKFDLHTWSVDENKYTDEELDELVRDDIETFRHYFNGNISPEEEERLANKSKNSKFRRRNPLNKAPIEQ